MAPGDLMGTYWPRFHSAVGLKVGIRDLRGWEGRSDDLIIIIVFFFSSSVFRFIFWLFVLLLWWFCVCNVFCFIVPSCSYTFFSLFVYICTSNLNISVWMSVWKLIYMYLYPYICIYFLDRPFWFTKKNLQPFRPRDVIPPFILSFPLSLFFPFPFWPSPQEWRLLCDVLLSAFVTLAVIGARVT